jgi:hypothetical protein
LKFTKKGSSNLSEKETERLKQISMAIEAYEKIKSKPIIYSIFLIQLILFACTNPTSKQSKGDPIIAVGADDSSMNQQYAWHAKH